MDYKKKRTTPFEFVLDALRELNPQVRPMFGCHAVYVGEKIVLILRLKPSGPKQDNGVWLATTVEHHESLKDDFPSMRSISVFGTPVTGWQVLPVDAKDFEESVMLACELIGKGDARIGKIPKPKKRKLTTEASKKRRKTTSRSGAKAKKIGSLRARLRKRASKRK